MKATVKIAEQVFNSYEEYEQAYIRNWEKFHGTLAPDLNWVKKDWETRILHPELYK